MVGIRLIRIKSLELTPETRTDLIYLREPIGSLVFEKPCSRLRGEPTNLESQIVEKGHR